MPSLYKPIQRIAALSLLMLLLAAVWQLLLGPVMAYHVELRERIESQRTMLGRLKSAAAEMTEATRSTATAATGQPVVHLQGASEAIALANLQASVTGIATELGTRPQTTRMLPAIERDETRLAGVHIEIAASIDAVQRLLHALETARPVLFVEQVSIEPLPALLRAKDAEDGQLRTSIQVYGAMPRKNQ